LVLFFNFFAQRERERGERGVRKKEERGRGKKRDPTNWIKEKSKILFL